MQTEESVEHSDVPTEGADKSETKEYPESMKKCLSCGLNQPCAAYSSRQWRSGYQRTSHQQTPFEPIYCIQIQMQ
jgi:aspartate carbamoyltransferase regulatory subunit